jgi:hypothetical protein
MILDYIFTIIGIIITLIIVTYISRICSKFILGIIIILFIIVFILNIRELIKYIKQNKIENNKNSYIANYCNLAKYKMFDYDILIDKNNLTLFILYLILFIIFWYNKITNDILNNTLNSEIKILGFYKYYNKDIYDKYNIEYDCVYSIMISIALLMIVYGLNLSYYNFTGLNKKEYEVIKNIEIIQELIKENINKEYLNYFSLKTADTDKKTADTDKKTADTDKKTADTDKTIAKFIAKNSQVKYTTTILVKCYITHILFNIESRNVIDENIINIIKKGEYCTLELLSNLEIEEFFSKNEDIKNYDMSKILLDNKVLVNNDIKNATKMYNDFVYKLKTNYNNVKKYESDNILYYKLDLLFAKFSGVLMSIFAIIFLIKTEFKDILKNFIEIDPLEYTIHKYRNLFNIIIIITFLLIISLLFI